MGKHRRHLPHSRRMRHRFSGRADPLEDCLLLEREDAQEQATAEEDAQQQLAASSTTPYDVDCEEHKLMLFRLWDAAFPDLRGCCLDRSPEWVGIGFQSDYPLRDLRGAGFQGLVHLVHFLESSMLPVDLPPGFPLALASINVTGFLQYYFCLNIVYPGHGAVKAKDSTRQALFLCATRSTVSVLQALHNALLMQLTRRWCSLKMVSPEATLMDFPPLLQETFTHAASAIATATTPWHLADLQHELEILKPRLLWPLTRSITKLLLYVAQCGCSWFAPVNGGGELLEHRKVG